MVREWIEPGSIDDFAEKQLPRLPGNGETLATISIWRIEDRQDFRQGCDRYRLAEEAPVRDGIPLDISESGSNARLHLSVGEDYDLLLSHALIIPMFLASIGACS